MTWKRTVILPRQTDQSLFFCLLKDHYVYKAITSLRPNVRVQLSYLAKKSKNCPWLLKDESGDQAIRQAICSSPKQYILTTHEEFNFPLFSNDSPILGRKIKGTPKSQQKQISVEDFISIVIDEKPSKIVICGAFKRISFKIFLVRNKRKALSRFSSKRYFSDYYKTKNSYYSFPLNWSSLLCWFFFFSPMVCTIVIPVMDPWTEDDGRTDGRTRPLIEMRGRI